MKTFKSFLKQLTEFNVTGGMNSGVGGLEGEENISDRVTARFMGYELTQGMKITKTKQGEEETVKSHYISTNTKTTNSLKSLVSKINGSHANDVRGNNTGGVRGNDIITGGSKSAS